MNSKISILTILVLSLSLLIGCNINSGFKSTAVQVDASSENKIAQLKKELKLANERADLEKQKREFVEEQLKKLKEGSEKSDGVENTSQAKGEVEKGS